MHLYGKIFLWLAVLILIPAVVLTTMALDVRAKWQAEVKQRQDKIAATQKQLDDMRASVRNLEEELQQLTHVWGEVWQAPGSRVVMLNDGVPRFDFGVGQNAGLGRGDQSQLPTVFAFVEPKPGEVTRFIGEFEIGEANAQRAGGRLLRKPFAGEVQSWPEQAKVHLRQNIPGNWWSTIAEMEAALIIAESKLSAMKANEEIVAGQIKTSEESLARRMAELDGNDNAFPGASDDVIQGLVASLQRYDAERNELQQTVQQLRRKLVEDYLELGRFLSENEEILEFQETKLPQTASGSVVVQ